MEYNSELAIKAQKDYCETNNVPHFAPPDGKCYHCNQDIYEPIERGLVIKYITGITVKGANGLITGCPHCHHSFCD